MVPVTVSVYTTLVNAASVATSIVYCSLLLPDQLKVGRTGWLVALFDGAASDGAPGAVVNTDSVTVASSLLAPLAVPCTLIG